VSAPGSEIRLAFDAQLAKMNVAVAAVWCELELNGRFSLAPCFQLTVYSCRVEGNLRGWSGTVDITAADRAYGASGGTVRDQDGGRVGGSSGRVGDESGTKAHGRVRECVQSCESQWSANGSWKGAATTTTTTTA
jgi:hypothetical protein